MINGVNNSNNNRIPFKSIVIWDKVKMPVSRLEADGILEAASELSKNEVSDFVIFYSEGKNLCLKVINAVGTVFSKVEDVARDKLRKAIDDEKLEQIRRLGFYADEEDIAEIESFYNLKQQVIDRKPRDYKFDILTTYDDLLEK